MRAAARCAKKRLLTCRPCVPSHRRSRRLRAACRSKDVGQGSCAGAGCAQRPSRRSECDRRSCASPRDRLDVDLPRYHGHNRDYVFNFSHPAAHGDENRAAARCSVASRSSSSSHMASVGSTSPSQRQAVVRLSSDADWRRASPDGSFSDSAAAAGRRVTSAFKVHQPLDQKTVVDCNGSAAAGQRPLRRAPMLSP